MSEVYKNSLIKVEIENSEIPWLKIFTNKKTKEFSQCDINIASFGNYVPHVHFHIMARFEEDSYFPEPMWGKIQREAKLDLPSFENFFEIIKNKL